MGVSALLVGALRSAPPGMVGGLAAWWDSFFMTGVALLVLLLFGQVVRLDIDRRRKRVLLRRWGLLGLRVRAFPVDRVTAIYMERHAKEGRLTLYRMVLMDPEQKLVALAPYSLMELGMASTSARLHEYLQESRFRPADSSAEAGTAASQRTPGRVLNRP